MEEKLVSVIVPVYNAEAYICTTVDAIIAQTYKSWELLLINDGSTDDSLIFCNKYKNIDSRIKVINSTNKGAAHARNLGIEIARGEYICFIDSDDLVSRDYIESMLQDLLSNQLDMMICGYQKVYDFNKTKERNINNSFSLLSSEKALEELLYRKSYTSAPWCKLVKSEIVKKNKFPEGKLYEDQGCIYKWIASSRKIGYRNNILYFYLMHENSCQHSDFKIEKMDHVLFSQEILKFVDVKYPGIHKAAISRLFVSAVIIFRMIPQKGFNKEKNELKNIIINTRRTVLLDSKAKQSTRILALVSHISVNLLRCLGRIYDWGINHLKIKILY